jgi:hypothetical protein
LILKHFHEHSRIQTGPEMGRTVPKLCQNPIS